MSWTTQSVNCLSHEDKKALVAGPVLVYLLVANADGNLDKAEKDAFIASMNAPTVLEALFEGIHLPQVMMGVVQNHQPHHKQLTNSLKALARVPDAESRNHYIQFLEEIGKSVAEASGPTGWLAFLKSNTSREEQEMLDEIHTLIMSSV